MDYKTMVYQIWLILPLYVLGLGFVFLFYPKIPISLCIMSALFWGALIYIFSALLTSFFGLYTRFIWALISTEIVIVIILLTKRWMILRTVPWRNFIIWLTILLFLFSSVFLISNPEDLSYFTSDSKAFTKLKLQNLNVFNSSSTIEPKAGKFFREVYGISEALMHSLARFNNEIVLTLWHPYLWISLYGSFFAILYEFSYQKMMNKPTSVVISLLMTIWVGTTGLNWKNGYYVHVHMITATSIFFAFYFFGKMIASDREEIKYGFLGALALCLFGFSRVESPILIGLFLAMLLGAKKFSRKEVIVTFFPPIFVEITWLLFLLFAYLGYESIFWSDSRIILALGAYIFFALLIVIFIFNNKLKDFVKKHITRIVFVLVLNISLCLIISKQDHQISNLVTILCQLFQGEIWKYYWWVIIFIYLSITMLENYFQNKNGFLKTKKLMVMMILVFFLIILDLGFFRKIYFIGWMDSASRMISHISPIAGFYTCKSILNFVPWKKILKKQII